MSFVCFIFVLCGMFSPCSSISIVIVATICIISFILSSCFSAPFRFDQDASVFYMYYDNM